MRRVIVLSIVLLISVSLMGQEHKAIRLGIDASVDCFFTTNNKPYASLGLGALARVGERTQWFNLIGGVRYIYGIRLSGFQIPVLLNVNLLKGSEVSAYLGGGYEFDFVGSYLGAQKIQAGLAAGHFDFRLFYKPYQGDLGAGVAFFF